MYSSKVCPAGVLCEAGKRTVYDFVADACPQGNYCERAAVEAVPCPAGSYNPFEGGEGASDCLECVAGGYCAGGEARNATGLCAPGFYCPAGSTTPESVPCPAGRFTRMRGAPSVELCALCETGKFCPLGTAEPERCPAGFFCALGSAEPAPCAAGSYGNSSGARRAADCAPCDAGAYCGGMGLTAPSGPCDAGFFGEAFRIPCHGVLNLL